MNDQRVGDQFGRATCDDAFRSGDQDGSFAALAAITVVVFVPGLLIPSSCFDAAGRGAIAITGTGSFAAFQPAVRSSEGRLAGFPGWAVAHLLSVRGPA
jgi:hypothetical protein